MTVRGWRKSVSSSLHSNDDERLAESRNVRHCEERLRAIQRFFRFTLDCSISAPATSNAKSVTELTRARLEPDARRLSTVLRPTRGDCETAELWRRGASGARDRAGNLVYRSR